MILVNKSYKAGLNMIGWETEIKLQNISKQEFSCNRSSLGVPVLYTWYRYHTGSKGLGLVPAPGSGYEIESDTKQVYIFLD